MKKGEIDSRELISGRGVKAVTGRVDRLSIRLTANYFTIDLMALYSSVIHDNSLRASCTSNAAVSIACSLELTRT